MVYYNQLQYILSHINDITKSHEGAPKVFA